MQLFFVRHASIGRRYLGVYIGSTDVSLSKEGIRQAHRLGEFLKAIKINAFYTSTLKRAVQTSNVLTKYISCSPKKVSEIVEISFGDWEGKQSSQVQKEVWQGESYDKFVKRVQDFLIRIIKKHKNDNVLIVAHAGVNREILRFLLKLSPNIVVQQDYGCVNMLSINKNEVQIKGINIAV